MEEKNSYWQENLRLIFICLAIWFIVSFGFGLLLDSGLAFFNVNIVQQMQHSHELLPFWFGLSCAGLIAVLSIKPLRKLVL